MTREITTALSPDGVLKAVRAFFLGDGALHSAWLESESESHLSFATFRGNLAVAAFPDPRGEAPTRVRVSTLREEGAVPRLLTYLSALDHHGRGGGEAEGTPAGPGGWPISDPTNLLRLRVLLFGIYREMSGVRERELSVTGGTSVADVVAELRRMPGLVLPEQPVVAVNQEYAELDRELEEGDEVALIPPVAGG